MGTADTGVCSAISLWQWNWWAPLPYPEGGFAWCDCSCITVHETYLDLTQQHEIGTTGAQEASNFRVHWNFAVLQEQPQTSKSWPTQNKMNTGGLCEKRERSRFHPRSQWKRESGLAMKLLYMLLSLFATVRKTLCIVAEELTLPLHNLQERGWVDLSCIQLSSQWLFLSAYLVEAVP